jgi:hypothetical protein
MNGKDNPMKRRIHDLIGLALIGALFLIEIPRYAETLPDRSAFVSLGMGLLLSGGAFYTIETWGMLKRKRGTPKGTNRLLAMTFVLVIAAPVIMTPPMVALQRGDVTTIEVLASLGSYTEELIWLFIVTIIPVATGVFVAYARSLQYSGDELNEASSKQQVSQLEAAASQLRNQVKQLEVALEQQVARSEQQASQLKAALSEKEQQVSQLQAAAERAKQQVSQLESEREQQASQLEQLESEMVALTEQQSRFVCESCGQAFSSQAALNAHGPARCAEKLALEAKASGNGAKAPKERAA